MSYITDKFEAGEVSIQNDVYGWLISDTDFRPFDSSQMTELVKAGYATDTNVSATASAYKAWSNDLIEQYTRSQSLRTAEQVREQRAEARAAFGPSHKVVNVFTGEVYYT